MKRQFSALLVLCAAPAFGRLAVGQDGALSAIDFGIVFPTSGTLNFDEGYVGTDIQVDNAGASFGNNVINQVNVIDGVLNFDSRTGEIILTGGVPDAGIDEGSVLMWGRSRRQKRSATCLSCS